MTSTTQFDLTRDSAMQVVRDCLARELRIPEDKISEEDRLDLLPNADSVRLMRAVARLEGIYDVEYDDDAIRSAETVADLAALVQESVARQKERL